MAKLEVTLKRSLIGWPARQRLSVQSLGLRKIRQTVVHQDNPIIRGLIQKVAHLVEYKEVE
jgi:large subunit ribosomal protein L30